MAIKASDLIAKFQQALDEKWGYIWGKSGQVWTQASQDAATRDMTVRYGQKWVGRKVADCSGLFVWAFKQLGASIYHGSNTIFNKYTLDTGAVAGSLSIAPGTAVFMVNDGKRTHIGLYIGDGKVIEAKGTQSGVVMSDLSRWDEWGTLTDVDYDLPAELVEAALPTLRKGSSGAAVKDLQASLNLLVIYGKLEVDGKFGSATLQAVRTFQAHHGLVVDGIVGPKTWAALQQTENDEDGEDKPVDDAQEPSEPSEESSATDTNWDTLTIEEKVEDLNKRLIAAEAVLYGGADFLLPEGGESVG